MCTKAIIFNVCTSQRYQLNRWKVLPQFSSPSSSFNLFSFHFRFSIGHKYHIVAHECVQTRESRQCISRKCQLSEKYFHFLWNLWCTHNSLYFRFSCHSNQIFFCATNRFNGIALCCLTHTKNLHLFSHNRRDNFTLLGHHTMEYPIFGTISWCRVNYVCFVELRNHLITVSKRSSAKKKKSTVIELIDDQLFSVLFFYFLRLDSFVVVHYEVAREKEIAIEWIMENSWGKTSHKLMRFKRWTNAN